MTNARVRIVAGATGNAVAPAAWAPLRAALYVRISRDAEGEELGVTRQLEDLQAMAQREGWTVAGVYQDNDKSASTLSTKVRPRFADMLNDVRDGQIDIVAAYTASRLTRRPLEFESLIDLARRTNVAYWFINSPRFDLNTADGRHVARILASTDAAEAERTAERSKRERLQRRDSGAVVTSRRCFGYADTNVVQPDGSAKVVHSYLHPDPVEAPLVRKAFAMAAGGEGAPAVGRFLAEFAPDRNWQPTSVHLLLARPLYAGLTRNSAGALIPAQGVKSIVEESIWHAAQAQLDLRRAPDHAPRNTYVLSGLVMCGSCGCRMLPVKARKAKQIAPTATRRGRIAPARPASWVCKKRAGVNGCAGVSRAMTVIDAKVNAFVTAMIEREVVGGREPSSENDAARAELANLTARLEATRAMMATDQLDMADGAAILRALRGQITALEGTLRGDATRAAMAAVVARSDALAAWQDVRPATAPLRAMIARQYVATVVVSPVVIPEGGTRRQASIDAVTVIGASET